MMAASRNAHQPEIKNMRMLSRNPRKLFHDSFAFLETRVPKSSSSFGASFSFLISFSVTLWTVTVTQEYATSLSSMLICVLMSEIVTARLRSSRWISRAIASSCVSLYCFIQRSYSASQISRSFFSVPYLVATLSTLEFFERSVPIPSVAETKDSQ